MATKSEIPFVEETMSQEGGSTRRLQVLTCTTPGCDCTKEWPVVGSAKPAEFVYNSARKAGWEITKKTALCPDHAKGKTRITKARKAPLAPEMRRAIFRAIDAHYDDAALCYRGVYDDEMVCKATGASLADVVEVREENFGPAENAAVVAIRKRLGDLESIIEETEMAILELTEKAEKLHGDAKSIRDDLSEMGMLV